MLIKTGGGDPNTGQAHGIHWHMNIGFHMEYIARDYERQDIPWVRVVELATGRETIYQNEDDPLTEEEIAAAEPRVVDCMDCHNRPSHIYNSPDHFIDLGILTDRIDRSLPEIKAISVEAVERVYETEEEAISSMATTISDHYEVHYPEVYEQKKEAITRSIKSVQEAFSQNIFPEMKVRWTEYPSNLGHFISPGCMRCHNSSLVSETGQGVTTDCRACHTILSQGSGESAQMATSAEGLEFVHPEDIGEMWREVGCYECHTGVQP
jgi:hypothetical protein